MRRLLAVLLLVVTWQVVPTRAQSDADTVDRLAAEVELDPESPARRVLGMVHLGAGRFLPAYANLRQWLRLEPHDNEARRSAAYAAVQLDRLAEAEELLVPLDRNEPRTALLWGDIHLRKGDGDAAVAVLEPLQSHPQLPPGLVFRLLAEAYLVADRHDDALSLLTSRDVTPQPPELALLRAEALFETGDVDGAIDALWPHRGSDVEGLPADLGRYLVLSGRFQDAVPVLEGAVEVRPDDRASWESLGRALFAIGRRDQAHAAAAKARDLAAVQTKESHQQVEHHRGLRDPSAVRRGRAVSLGDQDRWAEAIELLDDEIEILPDDAELRHLAAAALLRLDRPQEALAHSVRAVALDPESPQRLTLHATVLRRLGRLDEARALLNRALEVEPTYAPARRQLALTDETEP